MWSLEVFFLFSSPILSVPPFPNGDTLLKIESSWRQVFPWHIRRRLGWAIWLGGVKDCCDPFNSLVGHCSGEVSMPLRQIHGVAILRPIQGDWFLCKPNREAITQFHSRHTVFLVSCPLILCCFEGGLWSERISQAWFYFIFVVFCKSINWIPESQKLKQIELAGTCLAGADERVQHGWEAGDLAIMFDWSLHWCVFCGAVAIHTTQHSLRW